MENNKNGNSTIPLSITLTLDSRYYLGTTRDGVHFRKIADQETVASLRRFPSCRFSWDFQKNYFLKHTLVIFKSFKWSFWTRDLGTIWVKMGSFLWVHKTFCDFVRVCSIAQHILHPLQKFTWQDLHYDILVVTRNSHEYDKIIEGIIEKTCVRKVVTAPHELNFKTI